MSRLVVARLAVLLLAVALAMPYAASASPSHSMHVRSQHLSITPSTGPLASFWGVLAHLWAAEGCGADPYGRCAPSPASTTTVTVPAPLDAGCTADPYGLCSAVR